MYQQHGAAKVPPVRQAQGEPITQRPDRHEQAEHQHQDKDA
jgi:hypothetical protein